MRILSDSTLLDTIIYLVPEKDTYTVYIQSIPILKTNRLENAQSEIQDIKEAITRILKERILNAAPRICPRCKPGVYPKRYKTKHGVRILHQDPSMGWQPCEAETLFQALMEDTKEMVA